MSKLQKLFQAILQTEANLLPIFVHNPASQALAAVIFTTEQEIFSIFAPAPAASATPPATVVTVATASGNQTPTGA